MHIFYDRQSSSPDGRFRAMISRKGGPEVTISVYPPSEFTLSVYDREKLIWSTCSRGCSQLYIGDSGHLVVQFVGYIFRVYDIKGREFANFSVQREATGAPNVYLDPSAFITSAGLSALRHSHGYFFECRSSYFAIAHHGSGPLLMDLISKTLLNPPFPREVRAAHDAAEVQAALRQIENVSGQGYYLASILSLCRHGPESAIPFLQ